MPPLGANLYKKNYTSSHSGHTGSPVSRRNYYMGHVRIYPFPDVLCPQWAPVTHRSHYMHYTWMAYRLSHCIPSWSPLNPESHYTSTSCRSRHFMSSECPVSRRSTVWTRGKSMSLQAFWVSSEPYEPLYEPHACLAISGHSASPVSHRSHYLNHMPLNELCMKGIGWAIGQLDLYHSCHSGSSVSFILALNHTNPKLFVGVLNPQWVTSYPRKPLYITVMYI